VCYNNEVYKIKITLGIVFICRYGDICQYVLVTYNIQWIFFKGGGCVCVERIIKKTAHNV
jgi:hypothetical protein